MSFQVNIFYVNNILFKLFEIKLKDKKKILNNIINLSLEIDVLKHILLDRINIYI